MSKWPSTKARLVLSALLRTGWKIKRQQGTPHRGLSRKGWPNFVFAFHDQEEIDPRMLARIAKHTVIRAWHLFSYLFQKNSEHEGSFPRLLPTIHKCDG
ncbi:MAG: type II toxin-antitoxin system HicA family toxin [Candidatus Aminicenantes bacterium]|nr:MAG: type II toxin-antitoxin system HicA family toxin [Candidatus Aminicenantes bacterium]